MITENCYVNYGRPLIEVNAADVKKEERCKEGDIGFLVVDYRWDKTVEGLRDYLEGRKLALPLPYTKTQILEHTQKGTQTT
jgi:hypothetical protein